MCDLVIVSNGGKQTLAHSCILAIHSSVIASVLQSRISTDHDWSILRPLVINIDEVSVKDAAKEGMEHFCYRMKKETVIAMHDFMLIRY